MRAGILGDRQDHLEDFLLTDPNNIRIRQSPCASVQHLELLDEYVDCLHVTGDKMNTLFPMDIWERQDHFGRIARQIFYGTEHILKPQPNYDELVSKTNMFKLKL